MIYSEQEAKTKWCQMARLGGSNRYQDNTGKGFYFSHNGIAAGVKECSCLASACMMWVWDDGPGGHPVKKDGGEIIERGDFDHYATRCGRCGLTKEYLP